MLACKFQNALCLTWGTKVRAPLYAEDAVLEYVLVYDNDFRLPLDT